MSAVASDVPEVVSLRPAKRVYTKVEIGDSIARAIFAGIVGRMIYSATDSNLGGPVTNDVLDSNFEGTFGNALEEHEHVGDLMEAARLLCANADEIEVPLDAATLAEDLRYEATAIQERDACGACPCPSGMLPRAVARALELAERYKPVEGAAGAEPDPKAQCEQCGEAPAEYQDRGDRVVDLLCEGCAQQRGHERNGKAETAIEALGLVVEQLRDAGLTAREIRQAFWGVLTAPHSTKEIPVTDGPVVEGLPDRDWWKRTMLPVSWIPERSS